MTLIRTTHTCTSNQIYDIDETLVNVEAVVSFRVVQARSMGKDVYGIVGVVPWDHTYCFTMFDNEQDAKFSLNQFFNTKNEHWLKVHR